MFFGGNNNQTAITKFDWNTMTYTPQNSGLVRGRLLPACVLLRGPNGEVLVAIAGGTADGNETLNI